jgi:DNA polymerase-4/protein ImuB
VLVGCVLVLDFIWVCEARRHPDLVGRPVAVVGDPAGRRVVIDCSPAARAGGVRAGMGLREAQAVCPGLMALPADHPYYTDQFSALLGDLEAVSPAVEPAEPGCAYATADGLYGGPEGLARVLLGAVGDFPAAVGVGPGRLIARLAAGTCQPGEFRVVAEAEIPDLLGRAPVGLLPISDEARRRLGLFGIKRAGELMAFSRADLAAQLGPEGDRLYELLRGLDRVPLRPRFRPPAVAEAVDLIEPVPTVDGLRLAVGQLLRRALGRPELRGRAVGRAWVRLQAESGPVLERRVVFKTPSAQADRLEGPLVRALEALLGGSGGARDGTVGTVITGIALKVEAAAGEPVRQAGFWPAFGGRWEWLRGVVGQLRARYGRPNLGFIREVDPWSRLPERRFALVEADFAF